MGKLQKLIIELFAPGSERSLQRARCLAPATVPTEAFSTCAFLRFIAASFAGGLRFVYTMDASYTGVGRIPANQSLLATGGERLSRRSVRSEIFVGPRFPEIRASSARSGIE